MIASSKDEHLHHLSNRPAYHGLERKPGTATARRSCLSTFRAQLARILPTRHFRLFNTIGQKLTHAVQQRALSFDHPVGGSEWPGVVAKRKAKWLFLFISTFLWTKQRARSAAISFQTFDHPLPRVGPLRPMSGSTPDASRRQRWATGEPLPNIGVTPYCPRSLEPSCVRAFLAASQA